MRRALIRQAFGLKMAALLSDEVQIIWENTPVLDRDSFRAWLYLGLIFTSDAQDTQLIDTHKNLSSGRLKGWLAVPSGSGMQQLDSLIDTLDTAIGQQHFDGRGSGMQQLDSLIDTLDTAIGQQHFDGLRTKRLEAELPLDIPPFQKLHFAIPFTYFHRPIEGPIDS